MLPVDKSKRLKALTRTGTHGSHGPDPMISIEIMGLKISNILYRYFSFRNVYCDVVSQEFSGRNARLGDTSAMSSRIEDLSRELSAKPSASLDSSAKIPQPVFISQELSSESSQSGASATLLGSHAGVTYQVEFYVRLHGPEPEALKSSSMSLRTHV